LGKRKKTHVKGLVDDGLKLSTLMSSAVTVTLTGMVLYNLFIAQSAGLRVPEGATTKVSVAAPGKSSNTVTLRYDELVENLQRELLELGHFKGMVDGVSGPMTREAIIRYQREQNLEETGEASNQLLDHIQYTRKVSQAAEFTGSVKPTADLVVEDLGALTAKKQKPAAVEAQAPAQDKAILSVQKRLARLGFDPGTRSGQLDDATKSAILTFEMEKGLAMHGTISKTFLAALKAAEQQAGLGN
jgi:peptidoglycan hydrolase-like protein with peptidoglycan-binding domain